jgi:uncharacterized membrane protein
MSRALALAGLVILTNAVGNFALNWGMKHGGYFTLATLTGVALLILWTLSRIKLLAMADLSYVLPVTSVGFLLSMAMGAVFLGETVSWQRWMGGVFIVAGAALVTSTTPKTS